MTGLGQCGDHLTTGMRADAPLPMVICDEREGGGPSPRYALGPSPRLGPGFCGQQLPVSLSVAGLPRGPPLSHGRSLRLQAHLRVWGHVLHSRFPDHSICVYLLL